MSEIGYGPLWRVDGPPPQAPVYGLLQAAAAPASGVRFVIDTDDGPADQNDLSSTGETMAQTIARLKDEGVLPPTAGDYRWLNGAEVFPYPPGPAGVYEPCGLGGGSSGAKDFGTDVTTPSFGAFTVYVSETCKTYRVWSQQEYRARSVASLLALESAAVAKNLLDGVATPLSPHLADGSSTTVFPNGDAATSPMNALALLEEQIAQTGKLGLIHMSPQFASALRERFQIDDRGGVIRTINGNVVIPDAGYSQGAAPHAHAAATGTEEWLFATGPVDVRRTEVAVLPDNVRQAVDRGTDDGVATNGRPNTITYRAERHYLTVWDGELQAAVLSDRCQAGCTG